MDNQETIKNTKTFGLNTYESRIWVSLLSRVKSTAGELSDIANVPRSRSYDVLESLEKKGFVVVEPGKPIKYLAIPPKGVLENVKKRIEKSTEKHLLEIKSESFGDLIKTFQDLYDSVDQKGSLVAVLKGRKNINKHLLFLFKEAKKDIFFSTETETQTHTEVINKTRTTIKSPKIGARICVIDENNSIIFPILADDIHPDYDLCVWIRDKQTTKFLKHLTSSI